MPLSLPRTSLAPPRALLLPFRSHCTPLARSHTPFQIQAFRPAAFQPSSTTTTPHPRFYTTTQPRFSPKMAPANTNNRAIVISGPSGAGKSTILQRLFADYPSKFGFSISHTTRSPRGGEVDGREYHFVSKDQFQELIGQQAFIEHAQFGGNCYGTSVQSVKDIEDQGRICILDIEMEGVKQVANHPTFPQPRFLFLSPPSPEILEQRLRSRASDSESAIQKRLTQAIVEMEFARSAEAPHEKIVVNDDLDRAYEEVKEFIVGKGE